MPFNLPSESNPNGYRSCVSFSLNGKLAVCTGRTGTDYSLDQGKTWHKLSDQGYFSCMVGSNYIVGVGRNGKVGRMEVETSQLPLIPNEANAP